MSTQSVTTPARLFQKFKLPVDIRLWNGKSIFQTEQPKVKVTVRTPRALHSLMYPSMGKLARHYVEQELDIDGSAQEIVRMGELLSSPMAAAQHKRFRLRSLFSHTRLADSRSIRQHYDVSDDFFGLWLDRQRVYSCAYFKHPDDTLDQAQEQKLDHICRKLRLAPGERFLDIGCGWGALLLWAARNYGVDATGITLSENQYRYVQARIREAGLEQRCRVQLLDYRDLPETERFDKIASVGMFEHVGKKNLPLYFAKIWRLLEPGGLVLNHGITIGALGRDELASDIGRFIDDYVFPDGELIHVSRVVEEMARQNLECADVENLRTHYAKTLWKWVERLESKCDAALAEVGEKTFRIWRIYMAGSAHAFERGWLCIFQVLAAKPKDDGSVTLPLTRDDIYATWLERP